MRRSSNRGKRREIGRKMARIVVEEKQVSLRISDKFLLFFFELTYLLRRCNLCSIEPRLEKLMWLPEKGASLRQLV